MADRVYFEEYANVLVFYLYLAKDQQIIYRILDNANKIYAAASPCDFEADTEFLNKLYVEPPGAITLPDIDVNKNRDTYRAKMDELDRQAPHRAREKSFLTMMN